MREGAGPLKPSRSWLNTVWQLYRSPKELAAAIRKALTIAKQHGISGLRHAVLRKVADPVQPVAKLLASAPARTTLSFEDLSCWPGQGLCRSHSVTIVIPTRGNIRLLTNCLDSLRRSMPEESRIDIIIVNNGGALPSMPPMPWPISVRTESRSFNWSSYNNDAVRDSCAEFALFLNDDVEALHTGWLDTMLSGALGPDIGAIGAKLLYPDGSIQHFGIRFSASGDPYHEGRHRARGTYPHHQPVSVPAVTGACLLTPLRLFHDVGGFDERLRFSYNDVDYCLRLRAAGRVVMLHPAVELIHLETATRPLRVEPSEHRLFYALWPSR